MATAKHDLTQNRIDEVWRAQWKMDDTNIGSVFTNTLFVEGYPVFKKYLDHRHRRVLEIGSGTGRYGLKIAQDFPESQVLVTDILDESVALINRLIERLRITNANSQKEDVLNLSFPDNSFDLVFCDVVIQHIQDDKQAVSEMVRVLKPEGTIILSVNNLWNIPHMIFKKLKGTKYAYGYEKSYSKKELRKLALENSLELNAEDGFYFAYGIYRLRHIYSFSLFRFAGKAINRITKCIDRFTNRFISKFFGFEIFIVAKKKKQ